MTGNVLVLLPNKLFFAAKAGKSLPGGPFPGWNGKAFKIVII